MPRRLRVRPSAVVSVLGEVLRHPANRATRLRSVVRVLRFQARGRVLRKPTTVPYARSSKIVARVDDGASRRAAYAPFPDYPEMAVWTQQLGDVDLFVDVGASVGLYSLVAAEQGAELICLEPLPRAREQLVANLALNGRDATVIAKAVAAEPGRMHLDGVDAQRVHLTLDGDGGLEVEVDTLDSVIGDRHVAGLKIDVEGAERQVLEGAINALRHHRIDLVQLEWNDMAEVNFGESREPVASLLRDCGYELLRPNDDGDLAPVSDISAGPDMFARPAAS
jgi:FkbM family methyltransferase